MKIFTFILWACNATFGGIWACMMYRSAMDNSWDLFAMYGLLFIANVISCFQLSKQK